MNEESKDIIYNRALDTLHNIDEENLNRYFVVYRSKQ